MEQRRHARATFRLLARGLLLACLPAVAGAQANGEVLSSVEIDSTSFPGMLEMFDQFGAALVGLGDLDGDGVDDLAVGQPGDDDAGSERGAVWILFLRSDGSVRSTVKIGEGQGGFAGRSMDLGLFGAGLAVLPDLDGNGTPELAIGEPGPVNTFPIREGIVWICFLNPDGTVLQEQAIGSGAGGFGGALDVGDSFGNAIASLGDLDGDGTLEVAIGAPGDDDGLSAAGAVWIVSLNADGSVAREQKISSTSGGLTGSLPGAGFFGTAVAALGDLSGDGISELAVGAPDILPEGVVWILELDPSGQVRSELQITEGQGGFEGTIGTSGRSFGRALAAVGDLEGSGATTLVVGASYLEPFDLWERGAVWVLHLAADGTVTDERFVTTGSSGFTPVLTDGDYFGWGIGAIGDRDGDGKSDVAVGAPNLLPSTIPGRLFLLSLEGVPDPADAAVRNGTQANPLCYAALELPRLGATFTATVDATAQAGATQSWLVGYASGLAPLGSTFGEVLVDPTSPLLLVHLAPVTVGSAQHSIAVPAEPSLLGFQLFTQVALFGGGVGLCNALDLRLGN